MRYLYKNSKYQPDNPTGKSRFGQELWGTKLKSCGNCVFKIDIKHHGTRCRNQLKLEIDNEFRDFPNPHFTELADPQRLCDLFQNSNKRSSYDENTLATIRNEYYKQFDLPYYEPLE